MTFATGTRARVIAVSLLGLAFIAGAAAGVIADRTIVPTPALRTRITMDMSGVLDKLHLTAEQRAQAEEIMRRRSPRTEEVMRDMAERLRAVSDSVDAELRTILTAEQRVRLDSLRREPMFMLKRKAPGAATTVDTVH